jgi:hypothetical protein
MLRKNKKKQPIKTGAGVSIPSTTLVVLAVAITACKIITRGMKE